MALGYASAGRPLARAYCQTDIHSRIGLLRARALIRREMPGQLDLQNKARRSCSSHGLSRPAAGDRIAMMRDGRVEQSAPQRSCATRLHSRSPGSWPRRPHPGPGNGSIKIYATLGSGPQPPRRPQAPAGPAAVTLVQNRDRAPSATSGEDDIARAVRRTNAAAVHDPQMPVVSHSNPVNGCSPMLRSCRPIVRRRRRTNLRRHPRHSAGGHQ